jgi:hypothetical protein
VIATCTASGCIVLDAPAAATATLTQYGRPRPRPRVPVDGVAALAVAGDVGPHEVRPQATRQALGTAVDGSLAGKVREYQVVMVPAGSRVTGARFVRRRRA